MIFRIYPIKDTWVTNDIRRYARKTGSNVGRSEELVVFKKSAISGTTGLFSTASLARSLLQFDLSRFSSLTASGDIDSTGATYHLRLNHKTSAEQLPYSYTMFIHPVSSSWDEGRGLDVVDLGDHGVANWMKRNLSSTWTNQGGDVLSSPTASFYFDEGDEDLETDITPIVGAWLTGTLSNNGLMVKLGDDIESNTNFTDYETKKFYSRQSDYKDRRPYVEVRSDDFIGDDRINMRWSRTGSLYLYNLVGGNLQAIQGQVIVTISDASGVLTTLTASQGPNGVLSASFALATGSYSGSLFYDKWRVGGTTLMTGTFSFQSSTVSTQLSFSPLHVSVRNLKDEYLPEEAESFEVFFKKRPTSLPVLSTSSYVTAPYIVETAYYAIENDATGERVVPFGTGSLQHTRLSYGARGNSFTFYMSNLHQGNVYRMLFLVDESGKRQVLDPGIKFKVV